MLVRPIITEKSTKLAGGKIYTFEVGRSDTKTQIKAQVEKMFGVKVVSVKTMTMSGKEYRTGKRWKRAYKPDWKKAMVEILPTQKIDLFEAAEAEPNTK